jgi:alkylation response protein AidB-like acyl-CoA dehydrogenase
MSLTFLELCQRLFKAASELDRQPRWPAEQLKWLSQAGVLPWFIPAQYGGTGRSEAEVLEAYLALSQNCLTTTFVLTQWHAAVRRIASSQNEAVKQRWLPRLASGEAFATVGISHLSTSRQHWKQAALSIEARSDGSYLLNGFSPWVTGGRAADVIVLGASLPSGEQVLAAVPTERDGVRAEPGMQLVALTASCTDQVHLENVVVQPDELLAGPAANVMQGNTGGVAGGLQTSTLALGLALAAVAYLAAESEQRPELEAVAEKMHHDTQQLVSVVRGITQQTLATTPSELRQQANSLVLRTTQAALQAAKGAGFVADHPTGRWAREALFFLVWSCPQAVAQANLCELAQLD